MIASDIQEIIDRLEPLGDDELAAVIARAKDIGRQREERRSREALAQIRRIAKAHGLNVSIGKAARPRGRPCKEAR